MIIKERKIPTTILKLRALERRLPSHHQKLPIIREDLKKRQAGYKGEVSLDYPLSLLEPKTYSIFHDLRLKDKTHFFQMDSLLVSQKFLLIIEVKNIAGTLVFDGSFNQLIRTLDGNEVGFKSPLTQVQHQESHLINWLSDNGLKDTPIYSIIVISNPKTIIRTIPENRQNQINHKVIHLDFLPTKVNTFKNSTTKQTLTETELKKTIRLLKKHHTEADYPIRERYNITKDEILKGVFCKNCNHHPLMRVHGTWFCPQCQNKEKYAHHQALNDYLLLIDSTITNRQLRDFLVIDSSATSTRLLQSMNLSYIGTNKQRIYKLVYTEEN